MIYTYIITSILTKRGVDFSKRANFGNRLGSINKKPRATVHGAGLYFLRGVSLYFLTNVNLAFLKLSFKSFCCRCFLFCSALCSRYMNHRPLIIIPPIKIFSSMFCLVFDCRLSVRGSVVRSSS